MGRTQNKLRRPCSSSKGTCQPVSQCVSLMCFFNSISTTLEVGGAKGMSYIHALPTQLTAVGGIILVVVCGHKYII